MGALGWEQDPGACPSLAEGTGRDKTRAPGASHLSEAGTEFLCCLHFSDAFAPTTFCCLDHQRVADPLGHLRGTRTGEAKELWTPAGSS